jgi:hypothetical protein
VVTIDKSHVWPDNDKNYVGNAIESSDTWPFAVRNNEDSNSIGVVDVYHEFGLRHAQNADLFIPIASAFEENTPTGIPNHYYFHIHIPTFVYLDKNTLLVYPNKECQKQPIQVFQPGILSKAEWEKEKRAVEEAAARVKRQAEEEAAAKAEEEARRKAEAEKEAEERRKAEEEQAVRDAKERVRYKKQWTVWLVLRIMFTLAFAGIGAYFLISHFQSNIQDTTNGDPGILQYIIFLVIAGCTLGCVFGASGWLAGIVGGVILGVVVGVTGGGVGYAIIAAIVSVIVLGLTGLAAGFIAEFFYLILKGILKAELKLERKEEDKTA